MKIFFDTEFTGLHKNTTLISIGLVDENNRTFYAEFSDYDDSQCNEWIYENVISHLKWSKEGPIENFINQSVDFKNTEVYGSKDYIRDCLGVWLAAYDSVELVSDVCHYDMVLFVDLFGTAFDLPHNVNAACHDINQDIANYFDISETQAFDKSRENIIEVYNARIKEWIPEAKPIVIEGDKHNSLYDAKVIKAIYEIISD